MTTPKTRIVRFSADYGWEGVTREVYKSGQDAGRDWQGIVRQVLVGAQDDATAFHVRYFEVAPGGYSSLEKHAHAHVVIAVRGQGRAILDGTAYEMRAFDSVYVAPWTPHQFLANENETFGFFCIVDAQRDRPQPVSESDRDKALSVGAVNPRQS